MNADSAHGDAYTGFLETLSIEVETEAIRRAAQAPGSHNHGISLKRERFGIFSYSGNRAGTGAQRWSKMGSGKFMLQKPRPRQSSLCRPLPDYLAPNLKLLFVGINPGLRSAAAGHYYANPQNPFWRLLHESGLTPVQLRPDEDSRMPQFGYGLTDIVKRPSRGASDLRSREFAGNRQRLLTVVRRCQPRAVCFNSKTAFEGFFGKGVFAGFGPQQVTLEQAPVFVVPSTSPANAAVSLAAKRAHFRSLRDWLEALP